MKYAQNATTRPRRVHSLAELRMALEDKARGQRISTLRKRNHLTQQAMAERLGIAYRTYQTWEAGRMPEWHNVEKLAKFFKVKPEAIVGEITEFDADTLSQLDRIEQRLEEAITEVRAAVATLAADNLRLTQALEELRDTGRRRPRKVDGG